MTDVDSVRAAVARELPRALADLEALVRIPSVSLLPDRAGEVARSAEAVAELVRGLGWDDVRVVAEGGRPAVLARRPAPPGAPTVTLYAHHDVQPEGARRAWASEPFELTERGGRLYGRGAVDDKGAIAVHLAALRALGDDLAVGVTLFVEGEEEVGSPTMDAFLAAHHYELAADAFVLLDSGNWEVGRPAVTSSLRGLADVEVELATLDHGLHSGQYGGVVPDAVTALCRLLATLWDADGSVAVAGLAPAASVADLEYPDDRLRAETGLLDGVSLIGRGSVVQRLWAQPAVTVIGPDAPPVAGASNTLAPRARAKVSLRLPPGQDAPAALDALKRHLSEHAPFGARVSFGDEHAAGGCVLRFDNAYAEAALGALRDAWGVEPVHLGMGGSIPLAGQLTTRYPDAAVLLTGIVDPDSRMHGLDESVDLGDFEKAAVAEALLLRRLAAQG